MGLNVIKFGGSVITAKGSDHFCNVEVVQRLAHELPDHGRQCVLVHGTGLVGKPPAEKYGYLNSGYLPQQSNLVSAQIKTALRRLNLKFIDILVHSSVNAIPIDTGLFFNETMDGVRDRKRVEWLTMLLDQGITPVFYGDMIPVAKGGFRVFSSDVISLILCRILRPDKMLFLSNVEGVFRDRADGNGTIAETLSKEEADSIPPSESDSGDVSGGMTKKINCALEISHYCKTCFIGSGYTPGVAKGFLSGEKVKGTLVRG